MVDYFIVTSQFEGTLFSSLLNMDPRKVLILRQPRCDALYGSPEGGMDCLRAFRSDEISENT